MMKIPVACVTHADGDSGLSRPFLAYIDTDDPIRGLAELCATKDYYPGVDTTVTVVDNRSFVLHCPADPSDPDDEPFDRKVVVVADCLYCLNMYLGDGEFVYVGLPSATKREQKRSLRILGLFCPQP